VGCLKDEAQEKGFVEDWMRVVKKKTVCKEAIEKAGKLGKLFN
jgi:hypothetical protein